MNIHIMLGAALLAGLMSVADGAATPAAVPTYGSHADGLTESQKVERLIGYLRSLDGAVFIRNGSEHSNTEAADHLQAKWEKHKNEVHTAMEFIEDLASASGITGVDYTIRFPDGTVRTTREVLTEELKRLEQQQP